MCQVSLGMMRSDLMLDKDSFCCCWKQVELNTIASGFGWMGPASGLIHRLVTSTTSPALKSVPSPGHMGSEAFLRN